MSDEEDLRLWDGSCHASEFHAFEGCKRKYWLKCSGQRPAIEKPSQKLGKNHHAILAGWLEFGEVFTPSETITVKFKVKQEEKTAVYTPDDQVRLARLSFSALPAPGEGICEVPFAFWFEDVLFAGTIDYLHRDRPYVIDHKSTANLRYAKTTKELRVDPQTVIYAAAAQMVFGPRMVDLMWSYTQMRGKPTIRAVPFELTKSEIEAQLRELAKIGREIVHLHTIQPDPMSFPPSPEECDDYGGCPYKSECTDVSALDVSIAKANREGKI